MRYLKEYNRNVYTMLLTSGRLNAYLADIDKQAQKRMERLTEQINRAQGIMEQSAVSLKSKNILTFFYVLHTITHRHLSMGGD